MTPALKATIENFACKTCLGNGSLATLETFQTSQFSRETHTSFTKRRCKDCGGDGIAKS